MSNFTKQDLLAYVDGTLAPERAAQIEREAQNNPELKARIDVMRTLTEAAARTCEHARAGLLIKNTCDPTTIQLLHSGPECVEFQRGNIHVVCDKCNNEIKGDYYSLEVSPMPAVSDVGVRQSGVTH